MWSMPTVNQPSTEYSVFFFCTHERRNREKDERIWDGIARRAQGVESLSRGDVDEGDGRGEERNEGCLFASHSAAFLCTCFRRVFFFFLLCFRYFVLSPWLNHAPYSPRQWNHTTWAAIARRETQIGPSVGEQSVSYRKISRVSNPPRARG